MTAVEELRAAAFQLRNPFHQPGLKDGISPELGDLLAAWLEDAAVDAAQVGANHHALAVAREILGTQPDRSQP